ncbi:MAG: ABC transporter substrate-binding protein [Propionibacteriales bacterium]|nr:ABC transporter substrate-binding protein [Propionibacteriales bacterium]
MRKPRSKTLAAVVAGGLMLTGCAGTTSSGSDDAAGERDSSAPLHIGAVLPLSGDGAYFGVAGRKGIELAVEQANAAGGVNGKDIRVTFSDSVCEPSGAKQAAEKVISDGVNAIIGDECSSATLGLMPVLEQEGVATITPGSSALAITDPGNDWTFRIMPNEVMQGADLAEKAADELGAKTAVILHENTDAGIGNAEVFQTFFEESGGEVLDVIGFDREVQDFTSVATRVAALGDVDVIPTYTLEGQGVNITNALAQANVTKGGGGEAIQLGTIWLPLGFEDKVAENAAEGYVRIVQFDPNDPNDAATSFLADFQQKYDEIPNHISAHAFDAANVWIEAAEKADSTDPTALRDALLEIEGFTGVTGTVTFEENDVETCSCPNERQNIELDTIHYIETQPGGDLNSLAW